MVLRVIDVDRSRDLILERRLSSRCAVRLCCAGAGVEESICRLCESSVEKVLVFGSFWSWESLFAFRTGC